MVRNPRQVLAEQARADADDRDLHSRTDKQRIRKEEADALLTLATDLSTISDRWLRRLSLDEDVAEAVLAARSITSHRARHRQLKAVRRLLKGTDWPALQAELDRLRQPSHFAPATPSEPATTGPRKHLEVLLAGGDGALEELLRACPQLDRQQLRLLLRNVRNGSSEQRQRAETKLLGLLRHVTVPPSTMNAAAEPDAEQQPD